MTTTNRQEILKPIKLFYQNRNSFPHVDKKCEEKGFYFLRKEHIFIYNLPFNCTQETK